MILHFMALYFFVCVIETIVQIFLLIKFKRTKQSNYLDCFMGMSIAIFSSVILAYMIFNLEMMDLIRSDNVIGLILFCMISIVNNTILLAISTRLKKKIQIDNNSKKKSRLTSGIVILIINIIVLIIIPIIVVVIQAKIGERNAINYLNKKYGNGNYKIIQVYKRYSASQLGDDLDGYYYKIKSDYMTNPFFVYVDATDNFVDDDYFLPAYYSEKYNFKYHLTYDYSLDYDFTNFNNYIKNKMSKKYSTEIYESKVEGIYKNYSVRWVNYKLECDPNYYIVPSNNGKIPTIDEIVDSLYNNINKYKSYYE